MSFSIFLMSGRPKDTWVDELETKEEMKEEMEAEAKRWEECLDCNILLDSYDKAFKISINLGIQEDEFVSPPHLMDECISIVGRNKVGIIDHLSAQGSKPKRCEFEYRNTVTTDHVKWDQCSTCQKVIHVYQEKVYEGTEQHISSVQFTEEFKKLTEEQRKILRAKTIRVPGTETSQCPCGYVCPYAEDDSSCRHKPSLKRKKTRHREKGMAMGTSTRRPPMATIETLDD